MKKLAWSMHMSLDGFAAGPNGEMDWIRFDDDIFDYAGHRTAESDTALYGRVTWEIMQAYWPTAGEKPNASKHDVEHSTWYNQVQKIVVSGSRNDESLPLTSFISGDLATRIRQLKQGAGSGIVMFGSPSVGRQLLQEGLVDDLWLFVSPVLLGQGIRMFPDMQALQNFELLENTAFGCGVVCLHYGHAG
ncbi:MAG: dihydrofolate reductase family protein [Saprospiraceae bacterium]|nr:dihydrofolate reductase family protein [Saprospiraceae bacterium]